MDEAFEAVTLRYDIGLTESELNGNIRTIRMGERPLQEPVRRTS